MAGLGWLAGRKLQSAVVAHRSPSCKKWKQHLKYKNMTGFGLLVGRELKKWGGSSLVSKVHFRATLSNTDMY